MLPIADQDPPARQIATLLRSNLGPLALAALLALAAQISRIVTYDPAVKGLTSAAVLEVALTIAAQALATMTGCWAVLSGGRPAGFRGLAALPPRRIGPFLGYSVLFNLWFLALAAVFVRLTQSLMADQGALTLAIAVGLITAATLMLMYLQLGFLFPDIVETGETSIIFAMALGLSTGARIISALALPIAALIAPQVILTAYFYDPGGMAQASDAWVSAPDLALSAGLALLGAAGAMACAATMARLYRELIQTMPGGTWR